MTYIMKRTQIYLDEAQDARLDQRARATGRTKSSLIRQAIDDFIGRPRKRSDMQAALEETAGALPHLKVPDRGEWDRGHG